MIVIFYALLVAITSVSWSWLWFAIALMMTIVQLIMQRDTLGEDNNYWKGPFS